MTGQARRHALAVQKYTTNANNSDKYEAIITTGSLQGRALPKHLKLSASSHCGEPMPTSGHESKCYCEKPWVSWPSELPSLGPGSHAVQKGEDEMQRICAKRDSLHLDKYPAPCNRFSESKLIWRTLFRPLVCDVTTVKVPVRHSPFMLHFPIHCSGPRVATIPTL